MSHMYPEGSPASFEDQSHIGQPNPTDKCWEDTGHEPDGWDFDEEQHAFLVSECEHCGIELIATRVETTHKGEILIKGFEEA